jgi:YVTN family beta-propeller protein
MKIRQTILKRAALYALAFGIFSFSLVSCEEENNGNEIPDVEGIYVVNEGLFGSSNGSITLLKPETGATIHNYFKNQNGRFPGDVLQDLSFSEDKGFIVANNSKKLEIVSKDDFTTVDVIPDISYPRQFLAINDQFGYLTNGNSADGSNGQVMVVNLEDYTLADTIEVGKGPESMVMVNNLVYVTNSGGFNADNTVSVIDPDEHAVIETITVGDIPMDIEKDENDNLWIFCKGLGAWQDNGPSNSSLVKINTQNQQTTHFELSGKVSSYGNYLLAMSTAKDSLYFTGINGVYKMSIEAGQVPSNPVINKIPYGLDVNPENGNIYCLTSYPESKGYAVRYDRNHALIDSIQVGYNPNAVIFE